MPFIELENTMTSRRFVGKLVAGALLACIVSTPVLAQQKTLEKSIERLERQFLNIRSIGMARTQLVSPDYLPKMAYGRDGVWGRKRQTQKSREGMQFEPTPQSDSAPL